MEDLRQDAAPPTAPTSLRILAAVAGIGVFVLGAVASLGGVVLAPLGMWLASLVLRRKGKRLSTWTGWFAASGTICFVLLIAVGGVWASTSGDTIAQIQHNMDSLSTAQRTNPPPRPAWADKLSPPGSQQRADAITKRLERSPAALGGMVVVGGIIAIEMYAVFIGTLGWGGVVLMHYASRGRWFG